MARYYVTMVALLVLTLTVLAQSCVLPVHNQITKPGSCLCVNTNQLRASTKAGLGRDGAVVLSKGYCFKTVGKPIGLDGHFWVQIQIDQQRALWVASEYMDEASDDRCECPGVTMVTRQEWGARPPKSISIMPTPVGLVFIHHTAMDQCFSQDACSEEMRIIQNLHMDDRGWDDIGYNFLIGGDGRVYIGRGWNRVGAHTYGYNDVAVAFSFMGNYMTETPNQLMLSAAEKMIQCGVDQGYITGNYSLEGHRDVRCTDCPGDILYGIIEEWPQWHEVELPPPNCTTTA